jgi:hypothetical protein
MKISAGVVLPEASLGLANGLPSYYCVLVWPLLCQKHYFDGLRQSRAVCKEADSLNVM